MTADEFASPDLAALVSARLCHDLISPIGAIGNGLELLELAGQGASPELALVSESLATALSKLRFFRIAFGPADAQGRLGPDEAAQICTAMFHGRFTVAWELRGDLPRPAARLAFLGILCLEKSLPMGGAARLRQDAAGGLSLTALARRITPPGDLWACARDGTALGDIRPDAVQFALLRQALADGGHHIEVHFGETDAEIRFALSPVTPALGEAQP